MEDLLNYEQDPTNTADGTAQTTAKTKSKSGKTATPATDDTPVTQAEESAPNNELYVHGFKFPLEIMPQLKGADSISFMRGTQVYNLTPTDLLMLAGNNPAKIKYKVGIGPIPWRAAIGIFVNQNDAGRNKAVHDMIQAKTAADFSNNLQ